MTGKRRWYHKYKRLNQMLFLLENSGRALNLPPPARRRGRDDSDIMVEISAQEWQIIGWTLHTPFYPDYPSVGVLFEDCDGQRIWWHFSIF